MLDLVAEKTGYPKDMLDLDLDLEADLGVDTVKQAEMFAAIRETYDIPRDPNLKLRDFPTLAHVIQFVYDRRPDLTSPLAAGTRTRRRPLRSQPAAAAAETTPVREKVLDLVAEKTGYPKDMLDLDLDLEADLGVDTVKQAEMFAAIRETYDIPRDPNLKLRDFPTLAHVIQFVYDRRPDLKAAPLRRHVESGCRPRRAGAAPSPATELRRRSDPREGARHRRRENRLSQRHAGSRSRPGGRSRHRHRETGRDVRVGPRGLQHPARPDPEAARLPDLGPRDPVRRGAAARHRRRRQPSRRQSRSPELATFEAADAIPRRVPVPALRPPLGLCKPTGVSLESGRRVFVMPDRCGVAEALAARLRALGVEVVQTAEALGAAPVARRLLAARAG